MNMMPLDPVKLDLNHRILIEASAGTGKTFTIAVLYVRLVLEQGLLPSQILVVTFTDAATKELRERIRTRLNTAAGIFAIDAIETESDAAIVAIRDRYFPDPADWPECRQRLIMAAELMDEAAISTIHGWCYRMLSEHAFNSNSLFDLDLDNELADVRLGAVQDYWRRFFYPLDSELARLIFSIWPTPIALDQAVRSLLPHRAFLPSDVPDPQTSAAQYRQRRSLGCCRSAIWTWLNWLLR